MYKIQFLAKGNYQVGQRVTVETHDAREAEKTAKSILKTRKDAVKFVITPG